VEVTRIYHTTKTACKYLDVTHNRFQKLMMKHKIRQVSKFKHRRRLPVEEIERLKECLS
jgi:hypothetical protein